MEDDYCDDEDINVVELEAKSRLIKNDEDNEFIDEGDDDDDEYGKDLIKIGSEHFVENFLKLYCGKPKVNYRLSRKKRGPNDQHIERVKIADMCILVQEFSRKCMNWPIQRLGKFVNDGNVFNFQSSLFNFEKANGATIDAEVLQLLYENEGNLILAGGSIVDLLKGRSAWIKDYDLFCIGKRPSFKFEDKSIETSKSITTLTKPVLQIVKRIYDSPEQVIGGFDLDSSRFYMNSNLEVFTTTGGLASILYGINAINFCAYSSSFSYRIKKYCMKGFVPIHSNKAYESKIDGQMYQRKKLNQYHVPKGNSSAFFDDYSIKLGKNMYFALDQKIKFLNFSCFMRRQVDCFSIANGKIFPKQDFLDMALKMKKKDLTRYNLINHYSTNDRTFPKTDNALTFSKFEINDPVRPKLLAEFVYQLRVKNIEAYYTDYASIVDRYRISNPGGQHTSSFHPLEFKTLSELVSFKQKIFKEKYIPHDFSTPDVMYWLLSSKFMKIPKPIMYMVATFLCSSKLLDYCSGNFKKKKPNEQIV
eukprot:TRINITY_DN598_c0_g1_i1.p1 TRINITY_DN598_c0_g1~~TRINITY_DN598_c0_g1_i1.p1  ORF type:complete len:532 (+),score=139.14 TRINITY_DN598_c0_g1_i1:79-1674(+)